MRIPTLPLAAVLAAFLASCSGTDDPAVTPEPASDQAADAEAKRPERVDVPAPPDVAAPPADAKKTESGVAYKVITAGTGTDHPTEWSRAQVTYTGWTTDGKMIETTTHRGRPANVGVDDRPGWDEALPLMVKGEKTRFWFPENVANAGAPGKPAGMLVYDIELVGFVDPPAAPADVAAPPADATRTPSGLAYKVVKQGTGDDRPSDRAKVIVNQTGWTPDGALFESTVSKGRPQTITLGSASMPGWAEAVQLMHRGEKIHVWIPERLVGETKTLPKGDLVYEIELLTFDNPIPAPEDVAAPPADAKKTASGLAYKTLEKGNGKDKPPADAIVTVNYTGWTTDGEMFDSSTKRRKPAEFPLDRVIAGWTEGLQLMTTGEKARFWIPEELAYKGAPGKPAGMLVFDVELLSWKTPPPPPEDVAAPPADAKKTPSGLAYKVISDAEGTEHPEATSRVRVHYTGWTTDGKMFDSSVQRGQPATFGLNQVIAGWTEGLQLMTPGDKYRFWIPQELAYKGAPGKPAGMLVFDVELLELPKAPVRPAGAIRMPGGAKAPSSPH